VDRVRGDAVRGQLHRRGHRVVVQGRLGRPVRNLLGKVQPTTGGEADDPAPPAPGRDVAPRELGDQQTAFFVFLVVALAVLFQRYSGESAETVEPTTILDHATNLPPRNPAFVGRD
jgi:hypothetical protein